MAKIFYSLSGEGRGHASRARTLIDDLQIDHDITVFAPAQAYDMLAPLYQLSTKVKILRIPGLLFHYSDHNRLDYAYTFLKSIDYLLGASSLVRYLCSVIECENPELVITDFEPALARAAEICRIPYVSVNHQHFLLTYDLSSLSPLLRVKAELIGRSLYLFYQKQRMTIVSSFYFPPLRPGIKNVVQVGVFLNRKIRDLVPVDGGYLLVYLRRFIDTVLVNELASLKRPVIIYNSDIEEKRGMLVFKRISPHSFLDDLAACSCLISTAGNQLVGEAMFLGKPVFAIPEPDNFEQQINGHFLSVSGAGVACELHQVSAAKLHFFLSNLSMYRARIDSERMLGNETACNVINTLLGMPQGGAVTSLAVS